MQTKITEGVRGDDFLLYTEEQLFGLEAQRIKGLWTRIAQSLTHDQVLMLLATGLKTVKTEDVLVTMRKINDSSKDK